MSEWWFTGKNMEHRCLSEQRIVVFTCKVIPVILRTFTGIIVWKGNSQYW